jgi:hypothetical protein
MFYKFLTNLIFQYKILLLQIPDITDHYCIFFVEYLPEDGRRRPKHVGRLPHASTLLYLIRVQLLVYTRDLSKSTEEG